MGVVEAGGGKVWRWEEEDGRGGRRLLRKKEEGGWKWRKREEIRR